MAWTQSVNFSAVAPKGVGSGYPPRGIYQVVTKPTAVGGTRNRPDFLGIQFVHVAQVAYVPSEDGKSFTQDPSGAGLEFRKHCAFPDGKNSGGDDARTATLKAALLAHGNGTRESLTSAQGNVSLSAEAFDNKPACILFDPPAAGAPRSVYPELVYLDQATFEAMVSGKRQVSWPQDKKSASAGSAQATQRGIAASGIVPSLPSTPVLALPAAPVLALPAAPALPSLPSAPALPAAPAASAANVAAVLGASPAAPSATAW